MLPSPFKICPEVLVHGYTIHSSVHFAERPKTKDLINLPFQIRTEKIESISCSALATTTAAGWRDNSWLVCCPQRTPGSIRTPSKVKSEKARLLSNLRPRTCISCTEFNNAHSILSSGHHCLCGSVRRQEQRTQEFKISISIS